MRKRRRISIPFFPILMVILFITYFDDIKIKVETIINTADKKEIEESINNIKKEVKTIIDTSKKEISKKVKERKEDIKENENTELSDSDGKTIDSSKEDKNTNKETEENSKENKNKPVFEPL